jgi:hypothetical protein
LQGPAGAGKTTAAVERLLRLLDAGVPAAEVLVMTPQRTLAAPYHDALAHAALPPGGEVTVLTLGGLARRMIDIFWPLVAEDAGFAHPDRRPTFLTIETAQYHMAHEVGRLIDEQHYFESVTIKRNRIYSQILDNLNKAALVGFDYTEIGARLMNAWGGESSQRHVYEDAQRCAEAFRAYCLRHNLLDFSLQIDVFRKHLMADPQCGAYVFDTFRHLIVDNVEEDTPTAHGLLAEWLPSVESALIVYDDGAGYRRFLGADPNNAHKLANLCDSVVAFEDVFVASHALLTLAGYLETSIAPRDEVPIDPAVDMRAVMDFAYLRQEGAHIERLYPRYHPEMLDRVVGEIARLVYEEGTPPGEIVVLAPFLGDALRFSLANRLDNAGVPWRSHRPSRPLHDEPATRTLLTLAAIAHPDWAIRPTRYDVAYALMQAVQGMDLVRAQLLAEIVYRVSGGVPSLAPFDQIKPEVQERITYLLGNRYDGLRRWINAYIDKGDVLPFDHFLARLFGEMISQPEYGFHYDFDAAEVTANLIESAKKFRHTLEAAGAAGSMPLGRAYIRLVQEGVLAAQYVHRWQDEAIDEEGAVLLAPAYTFLMRNRPVTYQFWLNVGSMGWWERLFQPLTHPYVLSLDWAEGRVWSTDDEFNARHDSLQRIVRGLIQRCRGKVYLGLSELDEQGNAQQGPLLSAISATLRRLSAHARQDEEV